MSDDPDSHILLEITRVGGAVEVRAISESDGLEVAFIAPAAASQAEIEHLARAKLAYVRAKGRGGPDRGSGGARGPDGRGGLIA